MKQRNIDELRFRQLSDQDLDQHIHTTSCISPPKRIRCVLEISGVRYFSQKAGDTADKLILLREEKSRPRAGSKAVKRIDDTR